MKDVLTLVPRVLLSVTLAEPTPSGSTGASRLCQGCSHPLPAPPGARLPSASPPCCDRAGGEGLSPPLEIISASWRTRIQIQPTTSRASPRARVGGELERLDPVRFDAHRAFHTRCTRAFDTPATPAIVLVLQCVSPSGRHSLGERGRSSSTVASGIEGLRPRPSRTCPNLTRPSSVNRVRQFATVVRDTDNVAAIVALDAPSAAINKALARTTSRCAPDCDRANDSNTSRCPSVTANAGRHTHTRNHTNSLPTICGTHH